MNCYFMLFVTFWSDILRVCFMIRDNISHCYWAMDVLRAMKDNPSFPFIKLVLPEDCLEDLRIMKKLIQQTGKVAKQSYQIIDDFF